MMLAQQRAVGSTTMPITIEAPAHKVMCNCSLGGCAGLGDATSDTALVASVVVLGAMLVGSYMLFRSAAKREGRHG